MTSGATSPALMNGSSQPTFDHLNTFDALRVVAAFGVVYFHVVDAPDRLIGYAGLPIFLMLSAILLTMTPPHLDFRAYAVRRAKRLLVPWLAWSAVYLVINGISRIHHGRNLFALFDWRSLLVGSSIHLWYLPFAFFMAIMLWILLRVMKNRLQLIVIPVFIALSVVLLELSGWLPSRLNLGAPTAQWLYGLPSITIGATIGLIMRSPNVNLTRYLLIMCTVVAELECVRLIFVGHYDVGVSYGLAIALICFCLIYRQRHARWIKALSDLTLGIYLSHPLVIMVWHYLVNVELPARTFAVLVVFVSAASTAILRRIPSLRAMV